MRFLVIVNYASGGNTQGRVITTLLFYCHFSVRLSPAVELMVTKCIVQFGQIQRYGKYTTPFGFDKHLQYIELAAKN